MIALRKKLAGLRARMRRPDFRPRYGIDRLMANIDSAPVTQDAPLLREAGVSWKAGRGDDAARLVARHFNERRTPRFLFDAPTLCRRDGELAQEARRWITGAGDVVRRMTSEALTVYATPAAALQPGFAWGGDWYAGEEDVLFPARPHRFGFMPCMALAIVGRSYTSRQLSALLQDWMDFGTRKPRFPFISTFVVAQRLLASSCAFHLLSAADEADEREHDGARLALLRIMSQDIDHLIPRIGKSYPNGHLLTDRFIGWFIAAIYPELAQGRLGMEETERLWLAEFERQTYGDGGDFEHSLHYHGLATELALAYLILKSNNGSPVPAPCADRIRNMVRLEADLAGPDGHAPRFGDSAEDPMFPLDAGTRNTTAAMRAIYRRLFAPSMTPLAHAHPANERAFWLAAGNGVTSQRDETVRRLSANPDSGLFVFLDDDETTRCVFRTGPAANTNTISGHMHADLMSVYLVYRSVPVLVDAGTRSYPFDAESTAAGQPAWRAYFAGPWAHNGVVMDGVDPLGPVTADFRSGPTTASVEHTAIAGGVELSLVEAKISSPQPYQGFVRGVIHVRGQYFLVYNVPDVDAPQVETAFPLQFAPGTEMTVEKGRALDIGARNDVGMRLVYSDELVLRDRYTGNRHPAGGWVSPIYGEVVPAPQLVFSPALDGNPSAFAFGLNLDPAAAVVRITSSRLGAGRIAFQVVGDDFCDHVLVNSGPPGDVISKFGIEFEGRLLWLRTPRSGPVELRALDIACCKAAKFGVDLKSESIQGEWNWKASSAAIQ